MKLRNGKVILSNKNITKIIENYGIIIERLTKMSQSHYSLYIDSNIITQMIYIQNKINNLRDLINNPFDNGDIIELNDYTLKKYHKLEEIWCELLNWMNNYDRQIKKKYIKKKFPKSQIEKCLICKEIFQENDRITFCTISETPHLYHYVCINNCFQYNLQFENKKCPYCRQNFHNYSLLKKVIYTTEP
jgi:hypothetical protein